MKKSREEVVAQRVVIGMLVSIIIGVIWYVSVDHEGGPERTASRQPEELARQHRQQVDLSVASEQDMARVARDSREEQNASLEEQQPSGLVNQVMFAPSVGASAATGSLSSTGMAASASSRANNPAVPVPTEGALPTDMQRYVDQSSQPQRLIDALARLSRAARGVSDDPLSDGQAPQTLAFSLTRQSRPITFAVRETRTYTYARFDADAAGFRAGHVLVDVGEALNPTRRVRFFFTPVEYDDEGRGSFTLQDPVTGFPAGNYLVRVYAMRTELPLLARGVFRVK